MSNHVVETDTGSEIQFDFAGQGQEEVSRLVPCLLREADGGQEGGGRSGGRGGSGSRSVGGIKRSDYPDLHIVVAASCRCVFCTRLYLCICFRLWTCLLNPYRPLNLYLPLYQSLTPLIPCVSPALSTASVLGGEKYTALFPYTGQYEDELSFEVRSMLSC